MSRGVGCRCGWDPELLWLWHRWAATAPVEPLAWEPPYAAGAALEKAKRHRERERDGERRKERERGTETEEQREGKRE